MAAGSNRARNGPWVDCDATTIEIALEAGNPAFVSFATDRCITRKVNERGVFADDVYLAYDPNDAKKPQVLPQLLRVSLGVDAFIDTAAGRPASTKCCHTTYASLPVNLGGNLARWLTSQFRKSAEP